MEGTRKRSKRSLCVAIAALSLLETGTALSQEAPVARAAPTTSAKLEEVFVTARRREENAQTVPISISAFSEAELQRHAFNGTAELTQLTPGLRFVSAGGGNNTSIQLRGQSRLPIGESPGAVAVYFNEVPLQNEAQLVPTFDIANIQVLKGPQGTLFGRNTTAGAVLITPKEPGFKTEGYANVGFGNYGFKNYEGGVTLPLVDERLSLRLAGQIRRQDGYTKNLSGGGDFDDSHNNSLRATLLWNVTDTISNLTMVDSFKEDIAGAAAFFIRVYPTGILRNPFFASVADCSQGGPFNPVPCSGFNPGRDLDDAFAQQQAHDRAAAYNTPLSQRRDIFGITNRSTFQFGDFTLKNILGYRTTDVKLVSDGDASLLPQVLETRQFQSNKQYSDELQLQGKLSDNINFTVGAFYLRSTPNKTAGQRSDSFFQQGTWGSEYYHSTTKAAFGQADFNLGDLVEGLSLTAGARYTWDRIELCSLSSPGNTLDPAVSPSGCDSYAGTPPAFPASSQINSESKAPTWTLSLNYQINDSVFAYLTNRRGYRQGGNNGRRFATPGTTQNPPCPALGDLCRDIRRYQSYDPEYVTDYELGTKVDWKIGDVGGRFNIDVFRSQYSDLQSVGLVNGLISPADPGLPPFGVIIYNGGKITVTGVDLEAMVALTPNLQLSVNGSYFHAKQDSIGSLQIDGVTPGTSIIGTSPKWSYNADVRYILPVAPAQTQLAVSANYFWQDTVGPNPDQRLDSYGLLGGRLEANEIAGSKVSVGFYIKNALNKEYYYAFANGVPDFGFVSGFRGPPRTYGIDATFRF
ncbi:MAG: TonB-dependent receptor [Verrucomicrobiaceae bacterium]|nr:TonB-dependent receptor [Verrucomicrobiaceae bacterium]